jgi:hypothetical protein
MMSRIEVIHCPNDGTAMNCHAEKPVEPRNAEEARSGDIVEQVHQCPRCGAVESRRVAG